MSRSELESEMKQGNTLIEEKRGVSSSPERQGRRGMISMPRRRVVLSVSVPRSLDGEL